MNDFIKGYPSSPSSSGEMFDGAALLLSARCMYKTRTRSDSVARRRLIGTTDGRL